MLLLILKQQRFLTKYPESQDINNFCWDPDIISASEHPLKETNNSDTCHFSNERILVIINFKEI